MNSNAVAVLVEQIDVEVLYVRVRVCVYGRRACCRAWPSTKPCNYRSGARKTAAYNTTYKTASAVIQCAGSRQTFSYNIKHRCFEYICFRIHKPRETLTTSCRRVAVITNQVRVDPDLHYKHVRNASIRNVTQKAAQLASCV